MAVLLGGPAYAEGFKDGTEAKVGAEVSSSDEDAPSSRRGRIELRRQNSERGTPEETTRTTLRLETFLDGAVSRLRLDLPFPDEKTDFQGDPFNPRLDDVKLRAYFRPYRVGTSRLSNDVEVTFPTADSPALAETDPQAYDRLDPARQERRRAGTGGWMERNPQLALFAHGRSAPVG